MLSYSVQARLDALMNHDTSAASVYEYYLAALEIGELKVISTS